MSQTAMSVTIQSISPLAAVGVDAVAPWAAAALDSALALPSSAVPNASAEPAPAPPAAASVDAARLAAAARQGGLAPLLADLAAALQIPNLPTDVRTAAAQVLSLQTPIDPPPTAADLRAALAGSGLLLEARLAAVGGQPPAGDLKAALLRLTAALAAAPDAAPADPSSQPSRPPGPPLPPPYRGGPLAAQAPVPPSLTPALPTDAAIHRLTHEATAAVARQVLLQLASATGGPRHAGDAPCAQWLFEIPFQGGAVAQFEIARDHTTAGHGHAEVDAQPLWRARFSLNLPPMGPVHASIAMSEGRARVTLWAETGDTHQRLAGQADDLARALRADDLAAQVTVLPGAPGAAPPAAGRFLDRAT